MTKPNSQYTAITDDIYTASLAWDDQDPNNTGWYLRTPDDGYDIDGDEDRDHDELIAECAKILATGTVDLIIHNGDQPYSRTRLVDGEAVRTRYL